MDTRSDNALSPAMQIPAILDRNATFPEKLMLLLSYAEMECDRLGKSLEEACIGWVLEGQAFVIRHPTEFVDSILPLAFPKVKFSSFTRKLYRWGFRQLAVSNHDGLGDSFAGKKVFGHQHFRRDDSSRMKMMQSITATTTRRAIVSLTNRQDEAAKRLAYLVQVEPSVFPTDSDQSDVTIGQALQQRILNLSHQRNSQAGYADPFSRSLPHHYISTNFLPTSPESWIDSRRTLETGSGEGLSSLLRVAMTSMLWDVSGPSEDNKLK